MAAHPLRITERDVQRLTAVQLVGLLNRLLRIEGRLLGMSQADIATSLAETAPDGGVDARVQNAPAGSDWIPEGLSVWQSKSGAAPGPAALKKEFDKPGVQAALGAGGAYRVWLGDDVNAGAGQTNRRNALVDKCTEKDIDAGRCAILFAGQVAEWANRFPAVVTEIWKLPGDDLRTWDGWANMQRYRQDFVPDDQRKALISAYERRLADEKGFSFLRIEGQAGVGKSRLALEVFRGSALADIVLYADQPDSVPRGLWAYLAANESTVILVVDECSYAQHRDLCEQAERCNGRLRLLTIGQRYASDPARHADPDVFTLPRLEPPAMCALLQHDFPLLPDAWIDFVIRAASGFVKIAVTLAAELAKSGGPRSIPELARTREVEYVLRQMLPDDADRRAMQAVALLRRVGWEGEVDAEGKAVSAFLGLDWHDTRFRVMRVEQELGLVARQGRYLYVTPHLLAVWLAADAWKQGGTERTWDLRDKLPGPLAQAAFEERVQDIGAEEGTRQLAETLLGPSGAFPDLAALEDRRTSRFFRQLAIANPDAGLRALRRLVTGRSKDELQGIIDGRADVIWSLQAIAWRADLFQDAAQVLLELGLGEDRARQAMGPYASEEWLGFFRLHLGGTAAPYSDRLRLLEDLLDDSNERKRLFAVAALAVPFSLNEHRLESADHLGGGPLPEEWRPADTREATEIRRACLALLDEALRDDAAAVRASAASTIIGIGRATVRCGLGDEYLDRIERLPTPDQQSRREVRETVETILQYEGSFLDDGQRGRAAAISEHLAGNSYADRLRRFFGKRTPGDRVDYRLGFERETEIKLEQAIPMAQEALADPGVLEPEWDWLLSGEAVEAYYFAWALGREDAALQYWPLVVERAARQGQSRMFASAYLRGQVEAGRLDREEVLDGWMGEPAMAQSVFDVIWRGDLDERDGERLLRLVEAGSLDAAWLGQLYFGRAFLKLSPRLARRLLEAALAQGGDPAADSALALTHLRMNERPDERGGLETIAWELLERPGGYRRKGRDTMSDHYAEELAGLLAGTDPARAADLALRQFDTDDAPYGPEGHGMGTLRKAAELDPASVWRVVATRLAPDPEAEDEHRLASFRLGLALGKWFPHLIPPRILLDWADANRPRGPRLLASLADVGGRPLSDLPRGILVRFGDQEEIRSALFGQFLTGSFWGPESGWLKEKLEMAETWTTDAEPRVREWATVLAEHLRERIRETERREEEEGI